MTTDAAAAPAAWQRGIPLDRLRLIRRIFDAHDDGLILGAFTAVKERTIAAWLDAEELILDNPVDPSAAVAYRISRTATPVRDFAGEQRATIPAGVTRVARIACLPGAESRLCDLLAGLPPPIWADLWVEHPVDRATAECLGWRRAAVKVRASSELVATWTSDPDAEIEEPTPADRVGIGRLRFGALDPGPLLDALDRTAPDYADHYSSYNLRRSWSAAALRSYGGDPAFIIKPAEMSKQWKAEHPDALAWEPQDTPLRAELPEAEPLIAAIPAARGIERIRLMRLAPGQGELSRHADITDPDAGTAPGKLLRIHVPLRTNPDVVFTSWSLDGEPIETRMAVGGAYYLDTRKPHRAVNGGDSERIHLVLDVAATPELLALL